MAEKTINALEAKRYMPQALYRKRVMDTTIEVINGFRGGQVQVKLQREVASKGMYSLSCKAQMFELERINLDASAGTVVAQAMDMVSPEVCKKRGYRLDDKGYCKELAITMLTNHRSKISITCMLCELAADGSTQVYGDYKHLESIVITADDLYQLRKKVHMAHQAALGEFAARAKEKMRVRRIWNDERILDI